MATNDYEMTKKMLDRIHGLQANSNKTGWRLINEAEEKKDDEKDDKEKYPDAIAITNDPKFGQNVLDNLIDQFKSIVDSGAEFSEVKEDGKATDNALIYVPSNHNLIFSGVIPRLNNLKFQFLLKTNTGDGLFIWADGMIINQENLQTLTKLQGFYKNWCDQWNKESKDFKTLMDNYKNQK